MLTDLTHATISTNGVQLHVVQAGPEDGPLVILLHGFPEFWYGWRHQIDALAAAGFRVWVPDQRGYNRSEKPTAIAAYRLNELAEDVVGLIDAAGTEKAHAVIGHDWGAAVAWWLALHRPEKLARLGILNVPHPAVMVKTLRAQPRQLLKSWYIFFFQIPHLPEFLIRQNYWEGAVQMLKGSGKPTTFQPVDFDHYRTAWSQPGAFTAMLNWYRAAVKKPTTLTRSRRVTVPTLMLWGAQDVALERTMAWESIQLCDRGQLLVFEQATHWVQHDEPAAVNAALLAFLFQKHNPE